ncbi:hypothetical protein B0A71_08960 [Flavobacterium tructae]|uniref:Uncharacterized protein n=1 Tax=Flavobacterium tructae TaxID=1114873 RepID=A0A1S1J3B8_9FLAO|nr:hypothetical protein BHE19_15185 [Flavobacterium tructae]OXB20170.1 hypothetical protein B0A71_08960 [Flavobacterium tructae]
MWNIIYTYKTKLLIIKTINPVLTEINRSKLINYTTTNLTAELHGFANFTAKKEGIIPSLKKWLNVKKLNWLVSLLVKSSFKIYN